MDSMNVEYGVPRNFGLTAGLKAMVYKNYESISNLKVCDINSISTSLAFRNK